MQKLDLNGKHGRATVRRHAWAKRLVNPTTLKTIIGTGRLVVQLLHIILSIIKIFRH